MPERAKPEETLVEARSDTDVQIVTSDLGIGGERLIEPSSQLVPSEDGAAASLSRATESRAPSGPFLVSRTGERDEPEAGLRCQTAR
ncbi:hypothetical protein L1887_43188 [Cichorium endivia]|nr:hypothetical protein L1887_43188 [Cichorium endivia]